MKKILLTSLFVLVSIGGVLLIIGYIFKNQVMSVFFAPTKSNINQGFSLGNNSSKNSNNYENQQPTQVVAENLTVPWEIIFLPDQSLLVTERPGNLVRIYPESKRTIPVSGVVHAGEGGLLGLALHPNFTQNKWLYLYLTTRSGDGLVNRVERYEFNTGTNELTNKTVIIDNISGANVHDGGRLAFGPDGLLYITTGDAGNQNSAQDINTLEGKILRLNDDGSIPADNPYGNAVYSYGHRNPQGLAWDNQKQLWSSEHGPSGTATGNDEINLIFRGGNYGWPIIKGQQTRQNMIVPEIESGSNETWAPGDIEIMDNLIIFPGLRGQSLYVGQINEDQSISNLTTHFNGDFGRIRLSVLGPDGRLYIATSNKDGRGTTNDGDDKIISIDPAIFNN